MTDEYEFLQVEGPGARDNNGVVLTLAKLGEGKARLTVDDVVKSDVPGLKAWTHLTHVTWNDYDIEALRDMALTDQQLQDIGLSIVSRLLASAGLIK